MSEQTPSEEQMGTVIIAEQAAQLMQATSRVHLNLEQDIVVTTEDKIWRILANHLDRIENRNAWKTPLGILIAITVVFPTTTFEPFIFSAATWEAIFVISWVACFFWLVRSVWQTMDPKSVIAFFKSPPRSKGPTIDGLVAEIKRTAIASEAAGDLIAVQEARVIFRDRFDGFNDWQQYGQGTVYQSDDIPAYSGTFCLKKDSAGDPSGGFRELGEHIDLGLVFSGWIYRPGRRGGGRVDRLALENSDFDGYGFAVDHGSNSAWIERRDNGRADPIGGSRVSFTPPVDQWYKFRFYVKAGGRLQLNLYSRSAEELLTTPEVSDDQYTSFDRVGVHGGFPYYVDELRIDPH